jgi:hypothetical protein
MHEMLLGYQKRTLAPSSLNFQQFGEENRSRASSTQLLLVGRGAPRIYKTATILSLSPYIGPCLPLLLYRSWERDNAGSSSTSLPAFWAAAAAAGGAAVLTLLWLLIEHRGLGGGDFWITFSIKSKCTFILVYIKYPNSHPLYRPLCVL